MPLSTKAIKNRIRSVQNTRKITKAMEMVAASKMKRAVNRSLASRRYAELALELLVNISEDRRDVHHLLMLQSDSVQTLVIVIASNKGLCGAYNVAIFKRLQQVVRKRGADQVVAVTVGRYAERFARRLGVRVVSSFVEYRDSLSADDCRAVSRVAMDEFLTSRYGEVHMLYTRYNSPISQEVCEQGLLPITEELVRTMIREAGAVRQHQEAHTESLKQYLFEPSREEVLDEVLPALTRVQIYQAIVESAASEHSSRMVAMKNASDNAKGMVDELTLWYNTARQAAITQEIVEIASGAAAVAG